MSSGPSPLVSVVLGSESDKKVMEPAQGIFFDLKIPFEMKILSAHRLPNQVVEYAKTAQGRGIQVIIAGAGLAAHLPGVVASHTVLPVIGVPISSSPSDNLLASITPVGSILQMPKPVPVACVGVNNSTNAALLSARILSLSNTDIGGRLQTYLKKCQEEALKKVDG